MRPPEMDGRFTPDTCRPGPLQTRLFRADFVAKLDKEQLPRNNRIEAREFLNQHCAWALDPELMLLAGPLKIVLQQNRPLCDITG